METQGSHTLEGKPEIDSQRLCNMDPDEMVKCFKGFEEKPIAGNEV